MLSNKCGAIAGAAMLGTAALLGTNAANAVKWTFGHGGHEGQSGGDLLAKETLTGQGR